jgi:nucleotidyltransferase substrate binding protein (TIGR01987 family)
MALELESLCKAVDALERSLGVAGKSMSSFDEDMRETVRAGVIQHFEMAYEQCWKFMQRWIRENVSPEDADSQRTRKELFRMAARHGLISDPEPWFLFGEARNLTSHTYDQEQAVSVYDTAGEFLPHAKGLLARLEERND